MAKPGIADEVAVLRFFEQGPIEKAELLYRIVREKIEERLRNEGDGTNGPRSASAPGKKRQPAQRTTPVTEVPTPTA